jgi:hypothetical protein
MPQEHICQGIVPTNFPDTLLGMKNLSDLEQDVAAVLKPGAEIVLAAGDALAQIRDRRLYKATGQTFEEYVQERFSVERSRAYHLISAARVIKELRPHFKVIELPQNESAARPLMKFRGQQLVNIWQAVLEANKNPRREDVQAVIKKLEN